MPVARLFVGEVPPVCAALLPSYKCETPYNVWVAKHVSVTRGTGSDEG